MEGVPCYRAEKSMLAIRPRQTPRPRNSRVGRTKRPDPVGCSREEGKSHRGLGAWILSHFLTVLHHFGFLVLIFFAPAHLVLMIILLYGRYR